MLINKGVKILEGSVRDIKKQYKSHQYEAVIRPFDSNEEKRITATSMNANELVNDLIRKGEIVSFNEILPTMNDIFINLVSSSNN